jgi:hypothetical protein
VKRRELVQVRELAAVLAAGAVVLDGLEKGLCELRSVRAVEATAAAEDGDVDTARWCRRQVEAQVWDMVSGLKDFGMGCWFVLTVLER